MSSENHQSSEQTESHQMSGAPPRYDYLFNIIFVVLFIAVILWVMGLWFANSGRVGNFLCELQLHPVSSLLDYFCNQRLLLELFPITPLLIYLIVLVVLFVVFIKVIKLPFLLSRKRNPGKVNWFAWEASIFAIFTVLGIGLYAVISIIRGSSSTDLPVLFLTIIVVYLTFLQQKNRVFARLIPSHQDLNYIFPRVVQGIIGDLHYSRIAPNLFVCVPCCPNFKLNPSRYTDRSSRFLQDNEFIGKNCILERENPTTIHLQEETYELLYVRIKYNSGQHNLRESLLRPVFRNFRWWIKFPDDFRILRGIDAENSAYRLENYYLKRSKYVNDKVIINPGNGAGYENLNFGRKDKKLTVIEKNWGFGSVEYFGTGQNKRVHIPVWVRTPSKNDDDDGEDGNCDEVDPDQNLTLEVTVNPPHFPHYQFTEEFDVELMDCNS